MRLPVLAVAAVAIVLLSRQVAVSEELEGTEKWAGHNFAARRGSRKAHTHGSHSHGEGGGGRSESERSTRRATLNETTREAHSENQTAAAGHGAAATAGASEGASEVPQGFDPTGIPRDPFVWDGQNSWEWDNPRTLYFEAVAGLGNRLRAVASAVVLAKEFGVGLKVIWRYEGGCEECGNPGFNSTWPDLFLEPRLRLADNFPGSNYTVSEEMQYLRAVNRDEKTPPLQPGQCLVHYPHSHQEMLHAMRTGWTRIGDEDVLCVKSDLWLTEAGEKEGKFFFRLLKPSAFVQGMIDRFKYETEWEENHMVGVHVRRGDLTIWGKEGAQHKKVTTLIPIHSYIEMMRRQKELAAGVKRVRFYLATDDEEAEAEIKAAFKPGYVMTAPKVGWSRQTVQGIQEALLDVMLLADCPVLIGTYYSSYSETAKMMGWPFYIQVGHHLKSLSIETVFEKDDEAEDDMELSSSMRRRLIEIDF